MGPRKNGSARCKRVAGIGAKYERNLGVSFASSVQPRPPSNGLRLKFGAIHTGARHPRALLAVGVNDSEVKSTGVQIGFEPGDHDGSRDE